MPFFWQRDSESDKQERQRREQEQQLSIEALKAGRLPVAAQRRLEEQRQSENFFSSDLSTGEHLLTREAGYEPLAQVMGSVFYKVGYRGYFSGGYGRTGEIEALSRAQIAARRLAIDRLLQEARLLAAHGVISVEVKAGSYDWSTGLVEFTALGTAIRLKDRPPTEHPFASDLSGQDFWQLHRRGWWPRDLAFGICSYYIYSDYQTRSILGNYWGSGWANREIAQYSDGFQKARHLAVERLTGDIRRARAQGVVGVRIDYEVEEIEYEVNDTPYRDLLVQFIALGTAIGPDEQPAAIKTAAPVLFYDLRRRECRDLSIDNIAE